jgi:hypothetical protein
VIPSLAKAVVWFINTDRCHKSDGRDVNNFILKFRLHLVICHAPPTSSIFPFDVHAGVLCCRVWQTAGYFRFWMWEHFPANIINVLRWVLWIDDGIRILQICTNPVYPAWLIKCDAIMAYTTMIRERIEVLIDYGSVRICKVRMIKVKIKLSLCLTKHHAMKTYWGSGGIAPRIFDLGTRWRWVVSFTPRPLYPQGKSPWYPLDGRVLVHTCKSEYENRVMVFLVAFCFLKHVKWTNKQTMHSRPDLLGCDTA